jgi:hypothetical protein
LKWAIRLRPHLIPIFLEHPTSTSCFAQIPTIKSDLRIPLNTIKMSAHDNYQTPLASRYASSGEYPAIPAPHRLISDCLTLAIFEA